VGGDGFWPGLGARVLLCEGRQCFAFASVYGASLGSGRKYSRDSGTQAGGASYGRSAGGLAGREKRDRCGLSGAGAVRSVVFTVLAGADVVQCASGCGGRI